MSRELDVRDFSINRVKAARETELHSLASEASSEDLQVRITRFDSFTGNPAVIAFESIPSEKGNYTQRALNHVQRLGKTLGLSETQPPEFIADPDIQVTSSGAVAVHLQQKYKGISIFQAAETVRFAPDGSLKETIGNTYTVLEDVPASPKKSVKDSVLKAAEHVAVPHEDEQKAKDQFGRPMHLTSVDLTGFVPKVLATFTDNPERPSVLDKGPFGDSIKANLVWFPLGDGLKLAWNVVLTMPDYNGQYRVIVDSDTGDILYSHQLMAFLVCKGIVFKVDGGQEREMINFPLPLEEYNLPNHLKETLPDDFPGEWVEEDSTIGNNANAHLEYYGPTMRGSIQGGILTFDTSDETSDYQKIVNAFYYNNYLHDFFYIIGFREADGNFQQNNYGRGGGQRDRVDVRVYNREIEGVANMGTPPDGDRAVMNLGLLRDTERHTAMDSSIVFHEYTHGVTNRMVGGPMDVWALEQIQCGGMGEGWSDYIACTINNTDVVGAWLINNPDGIRRYRYDSSFPDNFGDLGTGRYDEVHNIGEIWCATLMEMNKNIGEYLALELVIDALKLSPTNPSFIDMRDSILAALEDKLNAQDHALSLEDYNRAKRGIWAAFAKFGMGVEAQSNGASLSGIVASFKMSEDVLPGQKLHLEADPDLAIPDNQPEGVTNILSVTEAGKITQVAVAVNIEHTYIGDLKVSLTSPDGNTVILHNRKGARTANLKEAYTSLTTPALSGLIGGQAQGDWTLKVVDFATRDVGRLLHWDLDLILSDANEVTRGEAVPGLEIPDKDPTGVISSISITKPGVTRSIRVGVDITHTYIGDLRVELIAPSGNKAIIQNRVGGSQDNLITTFDSVSNAGLATLLGEEMIGDWSLKVSDLLGQDVGKLNRWDIELA
jgi:extracellular elastinolytic metalloproteinase